MDNHRPGYLVREWFSTILLFAILASIGIGGLWLFNHKGTPPPKVTAICPECGKEIEVKLRKLNEAGDKR